MYVIMGATGQTGSAAAQYLLMQRAPVRVVIRDPAKAGEWRARGAEAAIADAGDASALAGAFDGAAAVYAMNPPAYGAPDLYARAHAVHTAIVSAATAARVGRLVALSSIGAQHATGTGNISTTHDFEARLEAYHAPVTIMRAANFMENWGWSMEPVRAHGTLPSMFLPLDRMLPMVSARDVGETAAALMLDGGDVRRLVELRGPDDYSPEDAARALSDILGKPVRAVAVPENEWLGVFQSQKMPPKTAAAFVEMYQGFNSGLIAFEGSHEIRRGQVTLRDVLARVAALRPHGH